MSQFEQPFVAIQDGDTIYSNTWRVKTTVKFFQWTCVGFDNKVAVAQKVTADGWMAEFAGFQAEEQAKRLADELNMTWARFWNS